MEKVTSMRSEMPPDEIRSMSQCFLEEGWASRHSQVSQEADRVGGTACCKSFSARRGQFGAERARVCGGTPLVMIVQPYTNESVYVRPNGGVVQRVLRDVIRSHVPFLNWRPENDSVGGSVCDER
jgi:hypothetical protein